MSQFTGLMRTCMVLFSYRNIHGAVGFLIVLLSFVSCCVWWWWWCFLGAFLFGIVP